MRRRWSGLTALFLLAHLPAKAADEERYTLSIEQAANLATRWFEDGRSDDARRLLALMKQAGLSHPQLSFIEGQIALRDGDTAQAIGIFRGLLATDPTLIRVRLELAQALFLGRDFDAARYHFEIALGERSLPSTARSNILGHLRRIAAQTSHFSVTAMLVPDTNATQATRVDQIDILGRTYTLNEDAKARKAIGLALFVQARHAFGVEHRSFIRSAIEHRDYPGSRADFSYGHATTGHSVFAGRSVWQAEAGPHAAVYQGTRLYGGWLAQLSHARPLAEHILMAQSLSWRSLSYPRFDYLSGGQLWLTHDVRYGLSNESALAGTFSFGEHRAREAPYSYRAIEWRIGYLHELRGGMIAAARVAGTRFEYRAASPLFGQTRHDRQIRLEFDATLRNWSVFGFAPRLLLSHTDNRSNLALYGYRRTYYGIGATREF